jgi:transcription initiation factor TFIIF subunit alpha
LAPGGRKLRAVDSGTGGLFEEDEDGEVKRRREKEYGAEGDLDEQVYEEDFADDEEQMDVEENKDEEAKEIEVGFVHLIPCTNVDRLDRSELNENTRMPISNVRAASTNLMRKNSLACPNRPRQCRSLSISEREMTRTRVTKRKTHTRVR